MIPITSIAALWDMDRVRHAMKLLLIFDDLIICHVLMRERGMIRLHDVVREVLASRLDDATASPCAAD